MSIHAAATWALVGLIWTIQLVHYPLFAHVRRETFAEYHQRHMQRITWVVAPLMLVEIATAGALLFSGQRNPWFLASLVPLATNWLSTWFLQIPLHNTLSNGFDAIAIQRLVSTNWWRTIGWSLRGALLLVCMHW